MGLASKQKVLLIPSLSSGKLISVGAGFVGFYVVEWLIRLMNSKHTGPFNLGNPGEFTIFQLAELLRARIKPALPIIEKPLLADDPTQRQPLIDFAMEELGRQPTVFLEQGQESAINWFKTELNNPQLAYAARSVETPLRLERRMMVVLSPSIHGLLFDLSNFFAHFVGQ